MYEVFKAWCKDNNNGHFISVREFRKELADYVGNGDKDSILGKSLHGIQYYKFTLSQEAKETYSYIYGFDSV